MFTLVKSETTMSLFIIIFEPNKIQPDYSNYSFDSKKNDEESTKKLYLL